MGLVRLLTESVLECKIYHGYTEFVEGANLYLYISEMFPTQNSVCIKYRVGGQEKIRVVVFLVFRVFVAPIRVKKL
jgi:hypothetical protein